MTKRKIAITVSEHLHDEAKRAVAEGRARSVSAYIEEAMTAYGSGGHGIQRYLDIIKSMYGEPSSEDYAWADEQLARVDEHFRQLRTRRSSSR